MTFEEIRNRQQRIRNDLNNMGHASGQGWHRYCCQLVDLAYAFCMMTTREQNFTRFKDVSVKGMLSYRLRFEVSAVTPQSSPVQDGVKQPSQSIKVWMEDADDENLKSDVWDVGHVQPDCVKRIADEIPLLQEAIRAEIENVYVWARQVIEEQEQKQREAAEAERLRLEKERAIEEQVVQADKLRQTKRVNELLVTLKEQRARADWTELELREAHSRIELLEAQIESHQAEIKGAQVRAAPSEAVISPLTDCKMPVLEVEDEMLESVSVMPPAADECAVALPALRSVLEDIAVEEPAPEPLPAPLILTKAETWRGASFATKALFEAVRDGEACNAWLEGGGGLYAFASTTARYNPALKTNLNLTGCAIPADVPPDIEALMLIVESEHGERAMAVVQLKE